MDTNIKKLKNYIDQQTPDYGYGDISTLLEMLYNCYTTYNPINSERIRHCLAQQDKILSQLTLEENDQIFSITGELCLLHERQAFLEGIRVGVRLTIELAETG